MTNSFSSLKSAPATTVGDETEKKRLMGANGKHPADGCKPFSFLQHRFRAQFFHPHSEDAQIDH
jgi:hypothetical protein